MIEFLQLLVYIMGLSNNDIKTVDDSNDTMYYGLASAYLQALWMCYCQMSHTLSLDHCLWLCNLAHLGLWLLCARFFWFGVSQFLYIQISQISRKFSNFLKSISDVVHASMKQFVCPMPNSFSLVAFSFLWALLSSQPF